MQNIVLVEELGCAFRWCEEFKQLEYCPIMENDFLNIGDWGYVEEDLVGEELVTFNGNKVTLSQVYRAVEDRLKV